MNALQLFLSTFASGILQVILVSLVPFIWWLVTARKKENFFKWLGLKGWGENKPLGYIVLIAVFFLVISLVPLYFLRGTETATSRFAGLGAAGIPAALAYAIIQTGLSEEIFFRGFLLKRIANKFGFVAGNIIQALLFGLMHGAMFFSLVSLPFAAGITLLTGAVAYCFGWVNEKKAGGSILPSWCIHALSNIAASFIALFSLIELI